MDALKEYVRSFTELPFMIRKNQNKRFKGYTHVIYLQHTVSKSFYTRIEELGFAHSDQQGEGGKFPGRIYIKQVGYDVISSNPGKRLWVCPECGSLHWLEIGVNPKIFHFMRNVCRECGIKGNEQYKSLEV